MFSPALLSCKILRRREQIKHQRVGCSLQCMMHHGILLTPLQTVTKEEGFISMIVITIHIQKIKGIDSSFGLKNLSIFLVLAWFFTSPFCIYSNFFSFCGSVVPFFNPRGNFVRLPECWFCIIKYSPSFWKGRAWDASCVCQERLKRPWMKDNESLFGFYFRKFISQFKFTLHYFSFNEECFSVF